MCYLALYRKIYQPLLERLDIWAKLFHSVFSLLISFSDCCERALVKLEANIAHSFSPLFVLLKLILSKYISLGMYTCSPFLALLFDTRAHYSFYLSYGIHSPCWCWKYFIVLFRWTLKLYQNGMMIVRWNSSFNRWFSYAGILFLLFGQTKPRWGKTGKLGL